MDFFALKIDGSDVNTEYLHRCKLQEKIASCDMAFIHGFD